MNILSVISEKIKTAGRVLFNGQAMDTGDTKGILSATGSNGLLVLCLVTMANAADLVLKLVTADDADGLNPVDLAQNVPVFKNDVRQADGIGITIGDASGVFTVAIAVPPILIPAGKYLCLDFANSNAANILSAVVLDDAYHESEKAA